MVTAETMDSTRMEVFKLLTVYERTCANYYQSRYRSEGRNVPRLIAFTLPLMMMVVFLHPKMLTN